MKIAVSNSGPLIHLAQINCLDLLFFLFDKVLIPKAVYKEVIESGQQQGHHDARYINKEIDKGRIEVKGASNELLKEIHNDNLHKGELEVIALALEMRDKTVLLDDEEARIFASTFNLKIKGTLGVIIDNVHSETISSRKGKELIKALNKIMYLSSDVFNFALENISSD
jgi:predicted nucleic acid-binding protein